jgi:hypothetical protein
MNRPLLELGYLSLNVIKVECRFKIYGIITRKASNDVRNKIYVCTRNSVEFQPVNNALRAVRNKIIDRRQEDWRMMYESRDTRFR